VPSESTPAAPPVATPVIHLEPAGDTAPVRDDGPVSILLVSGSTRPASTNTAALRTLAALAPAGVRTILYDGLADLPAFNPDDDQEGVPLPPAVARLRQQIESADGVLFSTPEYAGTLPGSFKNLLDWTVGGGQLYDKPAASLHVAAPGRGEAAQATLVTVLNYVTAVLHDSPELRLYVPRESVGPDGLIDRPDLRDGLARALATFAGQLR
jgi:chromate reductase